MTRVPLIQIDNKLIATVVEDLSDRDALHLQEDLYQRIERGNIDGVLLDLTVVDIVDSFLGRLINEVVSGSRLLGAETVVVGIQPSVAITLVELGLTFDGVQMALSADKGLRLLDTLIVASRTGLWRDG